MKIGKFNLNSNLLFAPIAGFSTAPVRRFMAENRAALTFTEMVSVKGLLFNSQKTAALLSTHSAERIKAVQLFGSEPDEFYRCASLSVLKDFDIIDINMGCPVKKIVNNGEGSALMASPQKAAAIVSVLKSLDKTVTVKTRLGIKDKSEILRFAPYLFDAGADMLTVHGRTALQMYCGSVDYNPIAQLKRLYPDKLIIANGDIIDRDSYNSALSIGADGVMIGRGAFINPQIFYQSLGLDSPARKDLVLKLIAYINDDLKDRSVPELRKFLPYLLKNVKGGKELRVKMNFSDDFSCLTEGIKNLVF